MIADDLVAAHAPWLTPDLETYLRAIGSMYAQVEQYALDPDETDAPVTVVIRANKCPNPSFEHDQVSATPAGWGTPAFTGGGSPTVTTFAVQTGWANAGAHSLRLTAASVAAAGTVSISHTTQTATAGQLWSARAAFNVLSATTKPRLSVTFYSSGGTVLSGSSVDGNTATGVQTLTGIDTVAPASTAFAAATLTLVNTSGAALTLDAYLDSIQLFSDGPVPAAFATGDTPGWQWTGTPGNSSSQPIPPVPQVGWSTLLDPDIAPAAGLPYLAQWAGERLPIGLAEPAARQWIKDSPNQIRGTTEAIVKGIFPFLTGTKRVFTKERSKLDGTVSSDWLAIITFASETPSTTPVTSSFRRTAPNDINVDYAAATTATWSGLESTYATWSALEAANSTWLAAEALTAGTIPPGFTQWTP